jgi:hypothetical protein
MSLDVSAATQPPSESDWSFEHIRTLITWLNYSNVNLFLIDMSIKYFKSILSQVMAYTLLFSTISSTISISQLGISQETTPALYKGIQYTFIAASTLSTLLVGYVKLFKVQESLDMNTMLYKKWLTFSTRISSEFQMPVHMRASALELLQDMKNEYIDLFCKNATIPFPVQQSANLYFQKNLATTPVRPSCWSRPNYIKRTNIFFIFQDIIKNEIKRLSAELTPISCTYGDEAVNAELDNVVPSYYPHKNTIPHYIGPQAIIEYKYDGPFIVIEVKDRAESATFIRHNIRQKKQAAAAAIAAAPPSERMTRRRTFLARLGAAAAADAAVTTADPAENDFLDMLAIPSRRERQMSFSLPERSIIQQTQQPQQKSSSSAPYQQHNQQLDGSDNSETHSVITVDSQQTPPSQS